MNGRALKTLEYYKILNILEDYACSDTAKKKCSRLRPYKDIGRIQTLQTETSCALARIWRKGSISFSGIYDVRDSLKRLEIGSPLNVTELLRISSLLKTALRIKNFSAGEDDGSEDALDAMFAAIEPLSGVNAEITRCIISEDEIADDASPELRRIRRSIRVTNDKIHTQLHSIVQSGRTYLQDALITMRNGRYCVPVKSEYHSHVPGLIHDRSATGSTIFVEPMAVVQLNNDIKELSIKEQGEIETILANLSNLLGEHIDELRTDFSVLTELDFIFARAMLSKSMKAVEPEFNDRHYINIKRGRHPLLDKVSVVPIDVTLGDDFDMIVITGPNTGGKTVSLKTVGLFTLMGQSGLHIPALEGSSLGVFSEVYADIGDEQSIEQNLSTFSAHMTNIVHYVEHADADSLVLFDELGAGTDPAEGAALAASVLSFLHNLGVHTIATTHYSELKIFALETDRVENACCEFDVETLRPTYRLLTGIPGKSNAFAISSRLGLPEYIIDDAKSRLSSGSKAFEDVLSDLENARLTAEKEREEIEIYKSRIEALKTSLEDKTERQKQRQSQILDDARLEARLILQEAKEYADKAVKDISRLSKGGDVKELEKIRSSIGGKIKENQTVPSLGSRPANKDKKTYSAKDFRPGTRVRVLSMGLEGNIVSAPNSKDMLTVQMGILRSNVRIDDLEIVDDPDITASVGPKNTGSGSIGMSKSISVSPEINVIGMTVDDAVAVIDKYLDDAYLAHMQTVSIVHGKGTGALRNGVHQFLKRSAHVKSFRPGEYGEGGYGVTVVEFK